MKLTVKQIASITKPGRHSDGRNLYLNVTATGAKSWLFMYKIGNGKRRELGLGSATGNGAAFHLTLTQARLAADAVRAQLARGECPLENKVAAKVSAVTFGELLEELLENETAWKVVDGVSQQAGEWRASLTKHAGKLLPMRAADVTTDVVVSVLKPIWKAIPTTAERIRFRIERVMAKSIARTGEANPARYDGHIEVLVGKRPSTKGQENHAALSFDAIPALIATLLRSTGIAAQALAFVILTAVRTDEARLMRVSEVDFATGLWTIPAERMKAGVQHIVPLSPLALSIVRSCMVEGSDFVFNGKNGALGATALNDKLTDPSKKGGLGFKGVATVHGMRGTFRTWASKQGYSDKACEMCLAHAFGTKTQRAYDHDDTVEQRTVIMQAWADYCRPITAPMAVAA
jgi:integrase